ncbi:MAG: hypothetical protein ACM3ZT_04340 [Bacillota bacterium]
MKKTETLGFRTWAGLLMLGAAASVTAAPAPSHATAAQAQKTESEAVHDFVQGFYDWYVGLAQKESNQEPPYEAALKSTRWPMSQEIVAALNADMAAQAKTPDDVVGIDFDPFLNAQDECFPYKAGKVTQTGSRYQVTVIDSHCSDPHPEWPTVIAVVEERKGTWTFVNFLYPGDTQGAAQTDLLTVLQDLKKEREQNPK